MLSIGQNGSVTAGAVDTLTRAGDLAAAVTLVQQPGPILEISDRRAAGRRPRRYTARPRACKHCGASFRPRRKTGRYCSDKCRQAAARARRRPASAPARQPALQAVTCPHCLLGYLRDNPLQVYCSARCRMACKRARRAAAVEALAAALGMPRSLAFDVVEQAGMTAITARLAGMGMQYNAPARAFTIAAQDLLELRQRLRAIA